MGDNDLSRFLEAQADVYDAVLAELQAGCKATHWMWFIFPQLRGLGRSHTAHYYGIANGGEARAYLAHPLLGPRLVDCTTTTLGHDTDAKTIFGGVDAMKFRSSMTLFDRVSDSSDVFETALHQFFAGSPDPRTIEMLD